MKKGLNTLFILVIKSPKFIKLFKILKVLKFTKPLVTLATVAMSVLAYSFAYGPLIAIVLVGLIFIHEMGHVIAMNKEGFPTKGPVFIPFLGAALFAPKSMDRRQEAVIGIGGPLLGSAIPLLLWGGYYLFPEYKFLLAIAYLGVFINAFNLIPISPLDGGRITQAVGSWFSWVGMLLLLAVTIYIAQPGILLIWILVLSDFKFFSPKQQFNLALLIWSAMTVMVVMGVGIDEQNFISNVVDVILGAIFTLMIYGQYISWSKKVKDGTLEAETERPQLPKEQRMKWFFSWLFLSIILVISMFLMAGQLKIFQLA